MAQFVRDANGFCTPWVNFPPPPSDGSTRILVIRPQVPLVGNWAPVPGTQPPIGMPKPIVLNETHCTSLDHDGYYEIHRAAAVGNHLLVQQILEDGVNIGQQRGHTPDAYLPNVKQVYQETVIKLRSRFVVLSTPYCAGIFYARANDRCIIFFIEDNGMLPSRRRRIPVIRAHVV